MKTLISILTIFILFTGCKKYPEDKALFHLQTAKQRLWKGNSWHITSYKVNGVDSLEHLNSFYWWRAPIETISVKILKDQLADDNRKITFGWYSVGGFAKEKYIWEIIRLDKNVLWIGQTGYNNTIYHLELKGSQ